MALAHVQPVALAAPAAQGSLFTAEPWRRSRRPAVPRLRLSPCAAAAGEAGAELQAAASYAVDKWVRPGQTIGLGTGLAVNAVLEELARRIDSGALEVGSRCL